MGTQLFDHFYQKKWIKFLKKNNYNKFNLFIDIGAHRGESIRIVFKKFYYKKNYFF